MAPVALRRLMAGAFGPRAAAAVPVAARSSAPAYSGDFPDPFILQSGGDHWAYSTGSGGRNLQVMSSTDLRDWSGVADPLPVLPAWARAGLTWAPGVIHVGGSFVMYYTGRSAAAGRQCISVATSATPSGPFTDTSSSPFICQLDEGGSIDPRPYLAPDGVWYLLWKSEGNALGRPTHLWGQRLTCDGRALVGAPARLLSGRCAWQAHVIEGPDMVLVGGVHYLFYSGGNWESSAASIGYATCASPLGPCHNASTTRPWMASHGDALGPSGPVFFVGHDGMTRMAYHAWTPVVGYANGGARSLWIDTVSFGGDRPKRR